MAFSEELHGEVGHNSVDCQLEDVLAGYMHSSRISTSSASQMSFCVVSVLLCKVFFLAFHLVCARRWKGWMIVVSMNWNPFSGRPIPCSYMDSSAINLHEILRYPFIGSFRLLVHFFGSLFGFLQNPRSFLHMSTKINSFVPASPPFLRTYLTKRFFGIPNTSILRIYSTSQNDTSISMYLLDQPE